jgi:hypothetical protein
VRFLKEQKCSFSVFCSVITVLWFPFAGQIRPDLEGAMVTGQHGSHEKMGMAE